MVKQQLKKIRWYFAVFKYPNLKFKKKGTFGSNNFP
jgi:hypothetical protein